MSGSPIVLFVKILVPVLLLVGIFSTGIAVAVTVGVTQVSCRNAQNKPGKAGFNTLDAVPCFGFRTGRRGSLDR